MPVVSVQKQRKKCSRNSEFSTKRRGRGFNCSTTESQQKAEAAKETVPPEAAARLTGCKQNYSDKR